MVSRNRVVRNAFAAQSKREAMATANAIVANALRAKNAMGYAYEVWDPKAADEILRPDKNVRPKQRPRFRAGQRVKWEYMPSRFLEGKILGEAFTTPAAKDKWKYNITLMPGEKHPFGMPRGGIFERELRAS